LLIPNSFLVAGRLKTRKGAPEQPPGVGAKSLIDSFEDGVGGVGFSYSSFVPARTRAKIDDILMR
jgi:hypothetical protein